MENMLQISRIVNLLSTLFFMIFILQLVFVNLYTIVFLTFILKFLFKLTLFIITINFKIINWSIVYFWFFNCRKYTHILRYFLKILAASLNLFNINIRLIIFKHVHYSFIFIIYFIQPLTIFCDVVSSSWLTYYVDAFVQIFFQNACVISLFLLR